MKRREFITLLGGAAATWPIAVRAQEGVKIARIGFLGLTPISGSASRIEAFRAGANLVDQHSTPAVQFARTIGLPCGGAGGRAGSRELLPRPTRSLLAS